MEVNVTDQSMVHTHTHIHMHTINDNFQMLMMIYCMIANVKQQSKWRKSAISHFTFCDKVISIHTDKNFLWFFFLLLFFEFVIDFNVEKEKKKKKKFINRQFVPMGSFRFVDFALSFHPSWIGTSIRFRHPR